MATPHTCIRTLRASFPFPWGPSTSTVTDQRLTDAPQIHAPASLSPGKVSASFRAFEKLPHGRVRGAIPFDGVGSEKAPRGTYLLLGTSKSASVMKTHAKKMDLN